MAFRSGRNPRGVYVVPALGGDARLVAPDGMAPRFSPDGRSIAYWTGSWLAPHTVGLPQRVFVVPSSGGEARSVGAGLVSVGDPMWLEAVVPAASIVTIRLVGQASITRAKAGIGRGRGRVFGAAARCCRR